MFKKLAVVTLAGTALSLGACNVTTSDLLNNVATIEAQVQADSALVCQFIPTAATIAAFIPGGAAVVPEAASIASAICNAIAKAPPVTTASARMRSLKAGVAVNVATVRVPGVGLVPISGQFITK